MRPPTPRLTQRDPRVLCGRGAGVLAGGVALGGGFAGRVVGGCWGVFGGDRMMFLRTSAPPMQDFFAGTPSNGPTLGSSPSQNILTGYIVFFCFNIRLSRRHAFVVRFRKKQSILPLLQNTINLCFPRHSYFWYMWYRNCSWITRFIIKFSSRYFIIIY